MSGKGILCVPDIFQLIVSSFLWIGVCFLCFLIKVAFVNIY